jgi:16S rRNA A1518/A1519 N6-dimethyltransferase RsmA/KsgA/DIM1 with predicted DNA glycosylase/AP lyase activity
LIQPIFNNNFRAIEKDETFKDVLNDIVENGEKIEENGEKIEENGEKIEESGEKIESRIIWNDVLQVDLETIKLNYNQTLVYGSLPYYITSPIISKFFLPTQAPSPSE